MDQLELELELDQPTKYHKSRTKTDANPKTVVSRNRKRVKVIFHNERALDSLLHDNKELRKLDTRSYLEKKDGLFIAHLFFSKQQSQLSYWEKKYPKLGSQKEVMADDEQYNASTVPTNRLTARIIQVALGNSTENVKRLSREEEEEGEEEKECKRRRRAVGKKGFTKKDLVQENQALKLQIKVLQEEAQEKKTQFASISEKHQALCNRMAEIIKRLNQVSEFDQTFLGSLSKKIEASHILFDLDPNVPFDFLDISLTASEDGCQERVLFKKTKTISQTDQDDEVVKEIVYEKQKPIDEKDEDEDEDEDECVKAMEILDDDKVRDFDEKQISQESASQNQNSTLPTLTLTLSLDELQRRFYDLVNNGQSVSSAMTTLERVWNQMKDNPYSQITELLKDMETNKKNAQGACYSLATKNNDLKKVLNILKKYKFVFAAKEDELAKKGILGDELTESQMRHSRLKKTSLF